MHDKHSTWLDDHHQYEQNELSLHQLVYVHHSVEQNIAEQKALQLMIKFHITFSCFIEFNK